MPSFSDPWLHPWLPAISARSTTSPVLEIGCGHGDDTAVLADAGLRVIAFDLSRAAVAAARLRVPSAQIECRDIRAPFPPQASELGAVIASLSLHYFPWDETVSIVQRIRDAMRPGGWLLCRLNSTEDHNFGAGQGVRIEENYYSVDGQPKRFFDEEAVCRLFDGQWQRVSMTHQRTRKYVRSKALWEVVVERV
ncbi:methyltransferase [Cupriavidus sp. USMAA2-4]|uniref:class I SAM-dependent methyltransferase n=1 Tax=unclassified Cupriavidus TaxID=2640874 RepID=UPI0008A70BE8|nr:MULTISPECIES: class I SAM-dependent methyltransferase [unclassified Cupriavidus]AOY95870.1 methyltransferase [Cupriavidus sp. USMAA2-4]AOZ03615.1 methyltransferase [Cupriavidus sp. USMAHM13]